MTEPNRIRARELAAESRISGDPTGWFEQLYQEQEQGLNVVPWADQEVNPNLPEFAGTGKTALTVGCGFGDDAEQLAAWGFETTAFDVSPTAIRSAKQRFPQSRVDYRAADVLAPPAEWAGGFDFVLESYTLQVLPPELRPLAIRSIGGFLKEGGMILLIARGRDESDPEGQMPWPLTRRELDLFKTIGLREESFEDYFDRESPPVRRFRAHYSLAKNRERPVLLRPAASGSSCLSQGAPDCDRVSPTSAKLTHPVFHASMHNPLERGVRRQAAFPVSTRML